MNSASEPAHEDSLSIPGRPRSAPLHNERLLPTDTQFRGQDTTPLSQGTPYPYLGPRFAENSGKTPLLDDNAPPQARTQVKDRFIPIPFAQNSGRGEDPRQGEGSVRQDAHVDKFADELEPISPPPGSAALKFRPMVLQPKMAIASMVLYLVVGASIGVLWWRSWTSGNAFRVSDQNIQLIARYLPTTTGTITFLLFRTTCTEAIRMMPYINMADQQKNAVGTGSSARKTVAGMFYPWRALWPAGYTPWSFITMVSFSSMIVIPWLVAAKSTLIAVVLVDNYWEIAVRPQQAIVLICSYIGMFLSTAFITTWFWNRETGLRWDPVSLADTIALFASCNALRDFAPLESQQNIPAARDETLALKRFRIGYWRFHGAGRSDASVVYGIGSMNHKDKGKVQRSVFVEPRDIQVACDENHQQCKHYPYQTNPGFSRAFLGFWMTLAYLCFIGCFYALASGHIIRGFAVKDIFGIDLTGEGNISENLSQTDTVLLYETFILIFNTPSILAGYLYFFLDLIDHNMRQVQPFVGMFENAGSASDTILLEYPSASPLQVPLTAWSKGHYKVCWFSILHSISPLFQIFVSSLVFPDKVINDRLHFKFTLPAFIGTFTFLLLYCVSLPLAWPNVHRLFPRQISCMADLMALCHQSRFLLSKDLNITDPETTREHMISRMFLHDVKYLFGVYEGRDGTSHLGFDAVETKEDGLVPGNVEWISPTKSRQHRIHWYYFGRGRGYRKERKKARDTEMGMLRQRTYARVRTQTVNTSTAATSSAVNEHLSAIRRG